jgi:FMN phosphatase YigB (HAD superfamily)
MTGTENAVENESMRRRFMNTAPLQVIFFDVGDTLGKAVKENGSLAIDVFQSTPGLLRAVTETLGLRAGIISNTDTLTTKMFKDILATADLLAAFDPNCIITSNDAGTEKPDPAIYLFAAQRAKVPIDQCLYVGEKQSEVAGALAAGMAGLLKPKP